MTRLSTHILDTSQGRPAPAVTVRLFRADQLLATAQTDADGRCANLIPNGSELGAGVYRLIFDIATYFPAGLYPDVTIAFKVDASSPHYHIPLLISPFGYTTYRGS